MIEAKAAEKHWSALADALAAEGWCCDYIRVDDGMANVFALEAHRNGIHHILISDELLPALLELRRQTIKSCPFVPNVPSLVSAALPPEE